MYKILQKDIMNIVNDYLIDEKKIKYNYSMCLKEIEVRCDIFNLYHINCFLCHNSSSNLIYYSGNFTCESDDNKYENYTICNICLNSGTKYKTADSLKKRKHIKVFFILNSNILYEFINCET